jgi:hypothetical protein
MKVHVHSTVQKVILKYCMCLGFPLPTILIKRNILAMNPVTIATAVGATTQGGSRTIKWSPSGRSMALHLSAQPDNANNVNVGPRPPTMRGVILAQ